MSKKWRLVAGLTVLLLVVSTLTFLVIPAEGAGVSDEELTPNDEYGWLDGVRLDGTFFDTDEEPEMDCFVGEKEIPLEPRFYENFTGQANVTYSEILTDDIVRLAGDEWDSMDEDDWVDGSDTFEWITDVIYDDTGAFTSIAMGTYIGTFEFNVTNEANPGIYRIPVELQVTNETGGTWYGPHTNLEYVYLEISGNAGVNDIEIDPGIEFERIPISVQNQGDTDLEDVSLTLDQSDMVDEEDNEITIHNSDHTSYIDYILSGGSRDMYFRFSVPLNMEHGDYDVGYELTATRADEEVVITEEGTFTLTIEPFAELSADIEENSLVQGTTKREFTVNFTNTGNLDLKRVSVAPDEGGPFSLPNDYYLYSSATRDDPLVEIGDLDVGESVEVDFILGIDQYIQVGSHKLFFEYEAYYYDTMGEYTGIEDFYDVHDLGLVADTDEPFAWIEVTEPDVAMDIDATHIDTVRMSDMGYTTISVVVQNNGYVTYSDAVISLHTSGTPFINPSDHNANRIEMTNEPFTLGAGSTRTVNFGVLIDTDFIEQRLEEDRPIYSAGLTLEGINTDTIEEAEVYFNVEGEMRGVGPRITVLGEPEDNTVVPGEKFELTYNIKNTGDEPVTSLKVTLSPHTDGALLESYGFESGQDAVYFRQASSPPGSYIWTVEPEENQLNPGENTTVTFQMVSSGDMQEGSIYHLDITVNGETATGSSSWSSASTIRTEESGGTKPFFTPQVSWIIVALILGIFFILGLMLHKMEKMPFERSKGPTEKEQEETVEEELEFEELEEDVEIEEEEVELEEGEIEPEGEDESEWTSDEADEILGIDEEKEM
ncbi:MAG: COG1361 S-layer family protein [Thermoplasmatota archaeon]